MVHSLGSSANFAACLLAHICVGAGENTSLKKILGYSVAVLPCSLTEEIHHELHAQDSVQTVISILGGVMGSRDDELITNIILYLNQSMRTAGQSQARVISKSHFLLFLATIASPNHQGEEPPKSLYSAIADFFEIFGQFCLYRSNVKALVQRTDQLNRDHENWQGHFKTPQVEGAWLLFQQCFAEGRRAKERRDSPLKMCTSDLIGAVEITGESALVTLKTLLGVQHPDYMMPYKDFDTIVHRARTLIARFLPRLALFYDKFVVYAQRNDLPPLLCIVDMTRFPQRIALHPDLSDAAYAQVGDVMPLRLAKSHPCLLVFAALPPADRSKLLFVHGTLQPSPSYTSYGEFLDSSSDPEASQSQLQLDIATDSLFPDVSFRWVTGGAWDSDSVTI
ncbi:hypothetical protein ONZ45_g11229 [Pleurotus djamor]|nr:hypothetical protein ONZ45_g11229 [Pleurotus djamor]